MQHVNNVFELQSVDSIKKISQGTTSSAGSGDDSMDEDAGWYFWSTYVVWGFLDCGFKMPCYFKTVTTLTLSQYQFVTLNAVSHEIPVTQF